MKSQLSLTTDIAKALSALLAAATCGHAAAFTDVMGNSKQNGFGPRTSVLGDFCAPAQICDALDLTGDGFADLVAIDTATHTLRLARNLGASMPAFAVITQPLPAAVPNRDFAWGDSNGDGRADLFVCDRVSGEASVQLTAAGGTVINAAALVARGFCRPGEQFRVADVNGDGRADALRFHMSATSPAGRVWVATNTGRDFAAPTLWNEFFGINDEQVRVADLTGDGRADLLTCLPGAGAFIAQSDPSDHFVASRRPLIGLGAALPGRPLVDLALPEQICMTGNFDGGRRHDLIVFAQGAGAFLDDFHDTRNDVYVALSHTELDLSDWYRLGPLRIRQDDFCRRGEQCAVADLNHDGQDDLISFSRGTDGSNRVNAAINQFSMPRSWALDLTQIRALATEGSGDKPLILTLNFRSTFGVSGSTVIRRNGYNENFAYGLRAGGAAVTIPTAVGRAIFPGVRLRTTDQLLRGDPLEVLGSVIIVMEKDLSDRGAYDGLLDEGTRALADTLRRLVERRSVAGVLAGGGDLTGSTGELRRELGSHIVSAMDDLFLFAFTGLWDVDDFVNVQVALFPALDKEARGVLPSRAGEYLWQGVPGEGEFGIRPGRLPFRDTDGPMWYEIDAFLR